MPTHDVDGNGYLKLDDAREGMTVWLDAGFTCHEAGPVQLHCFTDQRLYFECTGMDKDITEPLNCKHFIDGQCDDEAGICIGIYPSRPDERASAAENDRN
jgi:hypothetical protein